MAHPTRTVIVAPQDLIRNGLAALLNPAVNSIQIVGSYRDIEAAEARLSDQEVDLLLLDDSLPPPLSILEVLAKLRRKYPTLAILILSGRLSARYLQTLFGSGVVGFIFREDRLEETLLPGIETVMQGFYYTSPRASGLLIGNSVAVFSSGLNDTDLEVLEQIGAGKEPKDIAQILHIKPRSVYRIRVKLRVALGAPTIEHIVAAAIDKGLLMPDRRLARKSSP